MRLLKPFKNFFLFGCILLAQALLQFTAFAFPIIPGSEEYYLIRDTARLIHEQYPEHSNHIVSVGRSLVPIHALLVLQGRTEISGLPLSSFRFATSEFPGFPALSTQNRTTLSNHLDEHFPSLTEADSPHRFILMDFSPDRGSSLRSFVSHLRPYLQDRGIDPAQKIKSLLLVPNINLEWLRLPTVDNVMGLPDSELIDHLTVQEEFNPYAPYGAFDLTALHQESNLELKFHRIAWATLLESMSQSMQTDPTFTSAQKQNAIMIAQASRPPLTEVAEQFTRYLGESEKRVLIHHLLNRWSDQTARNLFVDWFKSQPPADIERYVLEPLLHFKEATDSHTLSQILNWILIHSSTSDPYKLDFALRIFSNLLDRSEQYLSKARTQSLLGQIHTHFQTQDAHMATIQGLIWRASELPVSFILSTLRGADFTNERVKFVLEALNTSGRLPHSIQFALIRGLRGTDGNLLFQPGTIVLISQILSKQKLNPRLKASFTQILEHFLDERTEEDLIPKNRLYGRGALESILHSTNPNRASYCTKLLTKKGPSLIQ